MRDLVVGSNVYTRDLIYLPKNVRYRHFYILGRTGAGKTSLMHQLIHQDVKRDYAVILFDAGDLATTLLQTFRQETLDQGRIRFLSVDYPIPYNPLLRRRNDPGRLENELFSLLDQVTVESSATAPLTARMKRVLSLALNDVLKGEESPTLSTLTTYLLTHRVLLAERLQLRTDEFTVAFEGVIDRLAQFLRDPRIRRIVCAPSQLDFDEVIDQGLIVLVSLAGLEKPLVKFLGTLLFQGLQATIFERPEARRTNVAIYVDEFQDYIASDYSVQNFQTIFNQGRRHKVSLTVAHQDFGTVDQKLLSTIHGNAGALAAFSCGPQEAERMNRVFGEAFPTTSIAFLPDYEFVVRLQQPLGIRTTPLVFKVRSYPPPKRLRNIETREYDGEDPADPIIAFANMNHNAHSQKDERRRKNPTEELTIERALKKKAG